MAKRKEEYVERINLEKKGHIMIDDKKIESAKEEIYEDKFLGCGEW